MFPLCGGPEQGSCHGTSGQMQTFYAISVQRSGSRHLDTSSGWTDQTLHCQGSPIFITALKTAICCPCPQTQQWNKTFASYLLKMKLKTNRSSVKETVAGKQINDKQTSKSNKIFETVLKHDPKNDNTAPVRRTPP